MSRWKQGLALAAVLLQTAGCAPEPKQAGLLQSGEPGVQVLAQLQIGDVILREGQGAESMVIAYVSGGRYTHVGMIINTQPLQVLHAAVDDDPQHPAQVIVSELADFLSRARSIALKRYPLNASQRAQLHDQARAWVGRQFDLSPGPHSLYCTTLLQKLLSPHTALELNYIELDLPLIGGRYLPPQSFFDDQHSQLLYRSEGEP